MIHELDDLLDVGIEMVIGHVREPAAASASGEIERDYPKRRRGIQSQKVEALEHIDDAADCDDRFPASSRVGVGQPHRTGLADSHIGVLTGDRVPVGEPMERRAFAHRRANRFHHFVVFVPVQGLRRRAAPGIPFAQGGARPVRRRGAGYVHPGTCARWRPPGLCLPHRTFLKAFAAARS